jgi:hypothetical protein
MPGHRVRGAVSGGAVRDGTAPRQRATKRTRAPAHIGKECQIIFVWLE